MARTILALLNKTSDILPDKFAKQDKKLFSKGGTFPLNGVYKYIENAIKQSILHNFSNLEHIMEIIKSELQTNGEEEINIAVAKELDIPDPENAEEILALAGLTIEQYNSVDPEVLKQILAGIPMNELGQRAPYHRLLTFPEELEDLSSGKIT